MKNWRNSFFSVNLHELFTASSKIEKKQKKTSFSIASRSECRFALLGIISFKEI